MISEPFPKSPCQLTYVLLIIFSNVTLKPVDYPIFLGDIILVLGVTRSFLMVLAPLKVLGLPPYHTYPLKLSLSPLV